MDILVELLLLDGRFHVQDDRNFRTVHQCLDGLPADLESNRTFHAAVRELEVPEFALGFISVDIKRKTHILKRVPVEQLSDLGHRGNPLDMSLEFRIMGGERIDPGFPAIAEDCPPLSPESALDLFRKRILIRLVTDRDEGRQGRETGFDRMADFFRPHISVSGGAGTGIGQAAGRDDQFPAGILFRLDRRLFADRRALPVETAVVVRVLADLLHRRLDAVEGISARGPVYRLHFAARHNLHAEKGACPHKGIDDVPGIVRLRESPVPAFHDRTETVGFQ